MQRLIVLSAIFIYSYTQLIAQIKYAPVLYLKSNCLKTLPDLAAEYGKNKVLKDSTHILPFYTAISFYPELKNIKIKVKYKNINTTMAARPTLLSLLINKPDKRKYLILINKRADKLNIPSVYDFTLNAQIGLFGHELAHLSYYLKNNRKKIIRVGLNYKKQEYKKAFEKMTDKITIEHGLGWQLYDFSQQLHNLKKVSDKYKNYKCEYYLTTAEIYDYMQELGYR
jgi:hypothetical protein